MPVQSNSIITIIVRKNTGISLYRIEPFLLMYGSENCVERRLIWVCIRCMFIINMGLCQMYI
jgi:hypothetical protein